MFYSIQIIGWNVYICTPRKINMSTKKNSFQKEISGNLTKIPMKSVQNSEAYSSFWCWAPRETLWLLLDSATCALTSWNSACRCYSCCFHLNLLPTICYSLLIHVAKYQLLNFAVFLCLHSWWTFQDPIFFGGTHTTVLRIMPYLGTCGLVWMYVYK